jgi:cytoskeletal protein CcmA (bactofilin family)
MEALKPLALAPEPEPAARAETRCLIGGDMSIAGRILCAAPVEIRGKVKGELRCAQLVIGDGARVEGSVFGQVVTVLGHVRGTIRAVHVKLLGRATVEGEIFHQELSMEEEVLFEGSSRPLP